MKKLFFAILAVLVVASIYTVRSLPDAQSDIPILYWVTDGNPERVRQAEAFRGWLRKHGHPDCEVRVDTVNSGAEKVLIQGVSGVCGDILDLHGGGSDLRFRHAVGLLEDVTDDARRLGFSLDATWPAVEGELVDGGRQYAFPCNLGCDMFWINRAVFASNGIALPGPRMTIAEFERIGKELVAKTRRPGELQTTFAVPEIDVTSLAMTLGGAIFNETQTAPVLSSAPNREALRLRYKWEKIDHIVPSEAEKTSVATASAFGGANLVRFAQGNYAFLLSGRWMLVQFRRFNDDRKERGVPPLDLGITCQPYGDMPCAPVIARIASVYAGGHHKDLAKLFLAYLASEDYSAIITDDADALPPRPDFATRPEFLDPPGRPEERGIHGAFAEILATDAVSPEFSPFVLDSVVRRILLETQQKYLNDLLDLDATVATMDRLIQAEFERALQEEPSKLPLYRERLALQEKIDDLRARGEKVPLSWISNPYWRKWYTNHDLADASR